MAPASRPASSPAALSAALSATAPLRWHPRFCARATEDGQTLLLEDGDVVWLEAGPAQEVAELLRAEAPAARIARPELRQALDELMALELIVSEEAHARAAASYGVPDFGAPPRRSGAVWTLGELGAASAEWLAWGQALAAAHRGAVVIVDDELDPRLALIERELFAEEVPWLLCKPRGRRPSFGPWFGAGSGACWSCLRHRLRANQPARRWLAHRAGEEVAVPICVELVPPARLPAALVGELRRGVLAGQLLQLERGSGAVAGAHHVAGSEHCPRCGGALRARTRREAPLALASAPRRPDPDGGYRVAPADETLVKLSRHVSRWTGVVADVSPLPGAARAVPIYRGAWLTCPLAAPAVRPPDTHGVALGKGVTAAQARASALGEALERAAAQYRGDEPCRQAGADELAAGTWISPEALQPLGAAQRAARAVAPWHPGEPLHWVEADSLVTGRRLWLPLTACYAHTPFAREEEVCRFTSNGCAAGRTLEEALLQAVLELVERDAVAIWWYNRLHLPGLPASLVGEPLLGALRRQLEPAWQWWLLDATHDLATPVCVAVARRRSDGQLRFGFGCHLEATLAAQRATTELCQLIALGERRGARFDFAAVASAPYLHPRPAAAEEPAPRALAHSTARADLRDAVLLCVERLAARGLDVLVHRYPAFDEAVAVVKAIAPGACHIWPELGAARLTRVPVLLGKAARPLAEAELNPLPLFL